MNDTTIHKTATPPPLASLSNSTFLKWFFLLNGGIVLTIAWMGPFALIIPAIGFIGALLSLAFAKWLAKRAHRIAIIDPQSPKGGDEEFLIVTVNELAEQAGLEVTPEVGIYNSEDMNAFATGANPRNALVAFSSGLLERMPPDQIRAVAAHEIAHIANRDMLGIVLLQGVINSIVLAVTSPLSFLQFANRSGDQSALIEYALWAAKALAAIVLTFLGSLVVKAFSRAREYRADAFSATLLGKESMVGALNTLSGDNTEIPIGQIAYSAFKVSGRITVSELFSTHPPIEKRIAALEEGRFTQ